jgi:hypothetical protein
VLPLVILLVLAALVLRPTPGLEGRVPGPRVVRNDPTAIEAAFEREGYRPGSTATLALVRGVRGLSVQLFHAGPERIRTSERNVMNGVPITPSRRFRPVRRLRIGVGAWPSGLYFARLAAPGGRVGFAPFVVRPARLGEHRVAVVLPTFTWQAYNRRDDDGDGHGDTWYADWSTKTARLARPHLNRGVPFGFRRYDLPFLRWLEHTGRTVDVLSDSDLASAPSARALAEAYDLIVFPGHHEYVTTREYDLVEGYRDLGGNLAFLSANNFFWRIESRGDVISRTQRWRDLDRPEAALIGAQYRGNDRGTHKAPWIVRDPGAAPWLFTGTGLRTGSHFGRGGIEIDRTTESSPPGTKVLAEIPDLFGPGFTAQMTYYETPSGAKVFAAGAFNLVRTIDTDPVVDRLVSNLLARLSRP